MTNVRNNFIILFMLFAFVNCGIKDKFFVSTNKVLPYEIQNFKIPKPIWRLAIQPTPTSKSAATVVLPIQVNDEYLDNADDLEENEIENQTDPNPVSVVEPDNGPEQNPAITNPSPAPVGGSPIPGVDEVTDPSQDQVSGQLIRFPCSCLDGQCGCCTGMLIQRLKMNACGNITFVPEDFVFDVRLSVNNNTVVRRRVSASDPPPICFNPRRLPFVEVCAEITNIRIRNRNAFACLDISANIADFPVYSASFRCFGLGTSGFQSGLKPKPVSQGPKPVSLFPSNDNNEDRETFLENAAGTILDGGDVGDLVSGISGGLIGGGGGGDGGGDGDDDSDGPLDAIGDAVGDFFE